MFVPKPPIPTRNSRTQTIRPPAARQQKHSLHHKAVQHPSADSLRHVARHHSLCPCHVTPGPSKTAGGGIPTFLPHQPATKKELKGWVILWICWLKTKNTNKISVFKSWFLGESFCSPVQVVFCEKSLTRVVGTWIWHPKKQNFCQPFQISVAKKLLKMWLGWSLAWRKALRNLFSRQLVDAQPPSGCSFARPFGRRMVISYAHLK